MTRKIVLFFLVLVTFSFTLKQQGTLNSILNLEQNQKTLQAINWPFSEGQKAPYPLKPTGATLDSIPTKGGNNKVSVNGTWTKFFPQMQQFIRIKCSDHQIHYAETYHQIDHSSGSESHITWNLNIPRDYPSGNYTINLWAISYNEDIAYDIKLSFLL